MRPEAHHRETCHMYVYNGIIYCMGQVYVRDCHMASVTIRIKDRDFAMAYIYICHIIATLNAV